MGFRARQEALSQVAGGSDCVHGEALSKSPRLAGTAKILNRAPGPPLCGGSVGCAVGPAAGLRHEAAVLCSSAPSTRWGRGFVCWNCNCCEQSLVFAEEPRAVAATSEDTGTVALGNVSGIINRMKMALPWRRIICLATVRRVLRAIGPLVCRVIIILTVLLPA